MRQAAAPVVGMQRHFEVEGEHLAPVVVDWSQSDFPAFAYVAPQHFVAEGQLAALVAALVAGHVPVLSFVGYVHAVVRLADVIDLPVLEVVVAVAAEAAVALACFVLAYGQFEPGCTAAHLPKSSCRRAVVAEAWHLDVVFAFAEPSFAADGPSSSGRASLEVAETFVAVDPNVPSRVHSG